MMIHNFSIGDRVVRADNIPNGLHRLAYYQTVSDIERENEDGNHRSLPSQVFTVSNTRSVRRNYLFEDFSIDYIDGGIGRRPETVLQIQFEETGEVWYLANYFFPEEMINEYRLFMSRWGIPEPRRS